MSATSSRALRACCLFVLWALLGCVPLRAPSGVDRSVGAPWRGYLLGGVRLADRGPGWELFRPRSAGGEVFATRRLVELLERLARAVVRAHGAGPPLVLGDLSGERGGQLTRHRSHRVGRDADLVFFALERDSGAPLRTQGFVRYDAQGAARDASVPQRFDVARNWTLAEQLAMDVDGGVARVFCSDGLRALLLEWARAHGRPPEVLARVQELLRQPSDSAAHDDHFHLRLACTPEERVAYGCVDGAPLPWWLVHRWERGTASTVDDESILAALYAPPVATEEPVAQEGVRARRRGAARALPQP